VAIATGRSISSIVPYLEVLGWEDVPVVCCNGSLGFMVTPVPGAAPKLRQIFSNTLPAESSRLLIALARSLGLTMQYYHGETGEVFASPVTASDEQQQLMRSYAGLTGRQQRCVEDIGALVEQFPSAKALILTNDPEALLQAADTQLPKGLFNVFEGSPKPAYFVEFLPSGVSKGDGLQRLCSELGVPLEETVAFGDGDNDKEFLECAGLGVAMKNAAPVAKLAADRVIEVSSAVL
jgi:hydroxymethylpyrimidine pyrophosphatase-like HAD family hydrolase